MPLLLDTSRSASTNEIHASNCVTIGLVNNMPDPALEATERQFIDLIRVAASKTIVRLLLFSIAEIPRADTTRQDMAERYRDVSELWGAHVDGLIVTGTEPAEKNPQRRAVLGEPEPGGGLGARLYRLDHLVMPRCARRRAPS